MEFTGFKTAPQGRTWLVKDRDQPYYFMRRLAYQAHLVDGFCPWMMQPVRVFGMPSLLPSYPMMIMIGIPTYREGVR